MANSTGNKKSNQTVGPKKKVPSVKGLQTGIITSLDDPAGDCRVKLILSGVPDAEGIFARMSSFDAGNNRGAFFMPEIGDEVIVGFLNNDSALPVVLGSLFGRKNKPPLIPEDKNHQKGYVSRSQVKIIFDDEKKCVTIETPAGNLFSMNEHENNIILSDSSGNKICMDKGGIHIEAANSITLRAGSIISISAQAIEINANNELKLGSSKTSISSIGVMDIKGSKVNIN